MNPMDYVKLCHVTSCSILILIIQPLYALAEHTGNSVHMCYPMLFGKIIYRYILKTTADFSMKFSAVL